MDSSNFLLCNISDDCIHVYVEAESSVLLVDESYILSVALRTYEGPRNEVTHPVIISFACIVCCIKVLGLDAKETLIAS